MIIRNEITGHFSDPMDPNYLCQCEKCMFPVPSGFTPKYVRGISIADAKLCRCLGKCSCRTVGDFIRRPSIREAHETRLNQVLQLRAKVYRTPVQANLWHWLQTQDDYQIDDVLRYEIVNEASKMLQKKALLENEIAILRQELEKANSSLDASSKKFGGVRLDSPST